MALGYSNAQCHVSRWCMRKGKGNKEEEAAQPAGVPRVSSHDANDAAERLIRRRTLTADSSVPSVGRVKPTRPASAGSCTGVYGESPRQRVTGVHQKENREWDGYQGHGTRRLSRAIQTHKICKDCALCKRHQVLE